MASEVTKLRRNFCRSHFREPTEKQIMKQWTKQQFILGLQRAILEAPVDSPAARNSRCRHMELWAKVTGATEPETNQTNNNVIFVTREENKEAWAQQALKQQNALRIKTKMATDTGVVAGDSS